MVDLWDSPFWRIARPSGGHALPVVMEDLVEAIATGGLWRPSVLLLGQAKEGAQGPAA